MRIPAVIGFIVNRNRSDERIAAHKVHAASVWDRSDLKEERTGRPRSRARAYSQVVVRTQIQKERAGSPAVQGVWALGSCWVLHLGEKSGQNVRGPRD
jgi:hypothetical protein